MNIEEIKALLGKISYGPGLDASVPHELVHEAPRIIKELIEREEVLLDTSAKTYVHMNEKIKELERKVQAYREVAIVYREELGRKETIYPNPEFFVDQEAQIILEEKK